ncbi:MAG: EF-hand domain-containing protein [Burkholderiales bacterium]|nr:MAG: EF-hand domain-containing protein [Burkholderiales bacterium]
MKELKMRKTMITASVLAAIGLASAVALADAPRGFGPGAGPCHEQGQGYQGQGYGGHHHHRYSDERGDFQERMNWRAERRMQRMDTDRDGVLSREEAEAAYQAHLQRDAERHQQRMQMFNQADTDGDGKLSRAEIDTWRGQMRERFGDRMYRGYRDGERWQRGPGGPRAPAGQGETSDSGAYDYVS